MLPFVTKRLKHVLFATVFMYVTMSPYFVFVSWGVIDIEDCCKAAEYLTEQGLADGERLCIDGGSAGGYTTLAALAFKDTFKAGRCVVCGRVGELVDVCACTCMRVVCMSMSAVEVCGCVSACVCMDGCIYVWQNIVGVGMRQAIVKIWNSQKL